MNDLFHMKINRRCRRPPHSRGRCRQWFKHEPAERRESCIIVVFSALNEESNGWLLRVFLAAAASQEAAAAF